MKNPCIVLLSLLMAACTPLGTLMPPSAAALRQHQITAAELAKIPVPITRVQSGDTLRIVRDAQESAVDVRSLVEDSQSQTYVVRPDGSFSYRYAGRIEAAGKTPDEVALLLRQQLQAVYREPGVTVNIVLSPSSKAVIGGAVRNPGSLDITTVATLEQGLFAAGGFLPAADPRAVALLRMDAQSAYRLYFLDMSTLVQTSAAGHVALPLQRGDIVFVPKSDAGNAADGVDLYINQLLPFARSVGVSLNKNL